MRIIETTEPINVIGLELRTSNQRAFEDIPAHWERFYRAGALASVPGRASDDVFAIYTNFEHAGHDNLGVYSFIIGAQVTDTLQVPSGMVPVVIAGSRRAVFSVDPGHPERVGERWRDIWACTDIVKTYVCDHERYKASGEIDIFVGIR
jgi:predicted transcriptional regulator YdeE